jgi:hypothetical protein
MNTTSRRWIAVAATTTSVLASAGPGHAAIVEGADVGIFRTFVDTQTGTVWADLDNHLGFNGSGYALRFADRSAYLGALVAAGFTWATTSAVSAFTATVPLATTQEYDALGSVMGSLSFGETTTLDGTADAGGGLVQRHFGQVSYGAGTASWAVGGAMSWSASLNDSGLWAYIAGPVQNVPEPGTLALAGLALLGAARPLRWTRWTHRCTR